MERDEDEENFLGIWGHVVLIAKFGGDAVGLEKLLRLLQSLCQITLGLIVVDGIAVAEAVPWQIGRQQLALGRRYLRFFRFIDAFDNAMSSFQKKSGLEALLEIGKHVTLGIYLGLESSTIIDAMSIYSTQYAPRIMLEANRFWFYSLVFSLTLAFYNYTHISPTTTIPTTEKSPSTSSPEEKSVPQNEPSSQRSSTALLKHGNEKKRKTLLKKATVDAFDLFIPGRITGWLDYGEVGTGVAMMISTLVASSDIWNIVAKRYKEERCRGRREVLKLETKVVGLVDEKTM